MRKPLFVSTLFLFLFTLSAIGQNEVIITDSVRYQSPTTITFVKYNNPNHTVKLKEGTEVIVVINCGASDSTVSYDGELQRGDGTNIILSDYTRNFSLNYNYNSNTYDQSNVYGESNFTYLSHDVVIPIRNIKYVLVEYDMQNLGAGIAGMSAVAGFLVAPLISINYRHERFNSNLYFKVAIPSALGILLGCTCAVIFQDRKLVVKVY